MILEVKDQDILLSTEKYIAHQCSLSLVGTGARAKGLAYLIFSVYPQSDVYKNRLIDSPKIGDISIHSFPGRKSIINCYSQIYPGFPLREKDTEEDRLRYLSSCFDKISKAVQHEHVAFPYNFGCGLAGGDWRKYESLFQNSSLNIVLYRKTN